MRRLPIDADRIVRISQGWDPPRHYGKDYSCLVGTPIYAAEDGIASPREEVSGFGRYVRIETQTHYVYTAHLSEDLRAWRRRPTEGRRARTGGGHGKHDWPAPARRVRAGDGSGRWVERTAGVLAYAGGGRMKKILLTQGKVALVDDDDYERLAQYPWCYKGSGYAVRRGPVTDGKQSLLYMHKEILNIGPEKEVDHINHDRLDNRRANLRVCDHAENGKNLPLRQRKSSRFMGVYWDSTRHRWHAGIKLNYRRHFLGRFDSEEAAARAYDEAACRLHGQFASTNETEGLYV